MGYTHYWTQLRDFTGDEWDELCRDVRLILKDVQHVQGVALAAEWDEAGTQPEVTGDKIRFNGIGDDGHETFYIERVRRLEDYQTPGRLGWAFCKTAQKPYDLAVVAILAYLESISADGKGFSVSSDGDGQDWLEGVELAKRALPRYANQIDIPLSIRKNDRWNWREFRPSVRSDKYDVRHCIDGHVYAFEVDNEKRCCRFETVKDALTYFNGFIEPKCKVESFGRVWNEGGQPLFWASGAFDEKRAKRLARLQNKAIKAAIDSAAVLGCNIPPPAFARPNKMPKVPREQATLADLFDLAA
jgi:hypothetical protein